MSIEGGRERRRVVLTLGDRNRSSLEMIAADILATTMEIDRLLGT